MEPFEKVMLACLCGGGLLALISIGTLYYRACSTPGKTLEEMNADSKDDETAKNLELLAQLPGFKIEASGEEHGALIIQANGWTYRTPRHGTKIAIRYALEWFKERPDGK